MGTIRPTVGRTEFDADSTDQRHFAGADALDNCKHRSLSEILQHLHLRTFLPGDDRRTLLFVPSDVIDRHFGGASVAQIRLLPHRFAESKGPLRPDKPQSGLQAVDNRSPHDSLQFVGRERSGKTRRRRNGLQRGDGQAGRSRLFRRQSGGRERRS